MPNYYLYPSLAHMLDAHETTMEAENVKDAARGAKLLATLIRPNSGPIARSPFGAIVTLDHQRGANYSVQGQFPLAEVDVAEEPTLARLILTGIYRSLSYRRNSKSTNTAGPLQSLVPRLVDLSVSFCETARPHVVTTRPLASFIAETLNPDDPGDTTTGFADPASGVALSFHGDFYAGVVATLKEAQELRWQEFMTARPKV